MRTGPPDGKPCPRRGSSKRVVGGRPVDGRRSGGGARRATRRGCPTAHILSTAGQARKIEQTYAIGVGPRPFNRPGPPPTPWKQPSFPRPRRDGLRVTPRFDLRLRDAHAAVEVQRQHVAPECRGQQVLTVAIYLRRRAASRGFVHPRMRTWAGAFWPRPRPSHAAGSTSATRSRYLYEVVRPTGPYVRMHADPLGQHS